MRPLVTTIIPVFNRAQMVLEAVGSVLAQAYRPIEIIVVDDGSDDGTRAVVEDLARRFENVRSLRIENSGPGTAREAGRVIAHGEYIQYLDSDDLLLPRRFELLVEALENSPSAGAAYGMTRYTRAGEEVQPTWKNPNQRQETLFPSLLTGRWWDTPSPLWRRSVTNAVGPWTSLRLEEDWEYDARAAALGTSLVFVPEVLVEVRFHDAHLSTGAALNPSRLKDRAAAHVSIIQHAIRAGVGPTVPEMQRFARELFHLSRQCGAAGLRHEARQLFEFAHDVSRSWDMRLYGAIARAIGWCRAGRLSMVRERFR